MLHPLLRPGAFRCKSLPGYSVIKPSLRLTDSPGPSDCELSRFDKTVPT